LQLGGGRGWRALSASGGLLLLVSFFLLPWIVTVSELAPGVIAKIEVYGFALAMWSVMAKIELLSFILPMLSGAALVLRGIQPIPPGLSLWQVIPEGVGVIAASILISRRPIAALIVLCLAALALLSVLSTLWSFPVTSADTKHLEAGPGLLLTLLGIVAAIVGAITALVSFASDAPGQPPRPHRQEPAVVQAPP
jgi:hypothetical protein